MHQHSTNDDFEVEQEVNIKTKLKGRGSMAGQAKGQRQGHGQFGLQGGVGFMGHQQMPVGQYGFDDPRMRRAPSPF